VSTPNTSITNAPHHCFWAILWVAYGQNNDKDILREVVLVKKCIVEVFSRVTGFFRPVQNWNKGKQAEFEDRKRYKV